MKIPKKQILPRKLPLQARAQETVAAILDATAHILVRDGMARLSTNRVAERAGVSIGSLYQYFPSKDALILALAERHHQTIVSLLSEEMAQLEFGPDPRMTLRKQVERIVAAMIKIHRHDPALHRALCEGPPRDMAFETIHQTSGVLIRAALLHYRDHILCHDLDAAAFLLVTTVEAATHQAALFRPELIHATKLQQELTDMITRYLLGS
jgi:AcrR family transcriptional regulator